MSGYIRAVPRLFLTYRLLAYLVGILLTVLALVAMPMKYFLTEGTSAQVFGDHLTMVVAIGHGYLYMAYLVVAFFLTRRARFDIAFTILVLAAGLLPLVIFWVERRVEHRVRAEHPELVGV